MLAQTRVAAPEAALPAVYQNWLDQDVAYIISDEERAQFLAFADDKDRDNFVRAFWEKRNPSPGNRENAYKEEHYRRIAYANLHFASGHAGWATDRGKTYIVLGPPDQITTSREFDLPAEIWHYRSTPLTDGRDVKFVDRCKCGEFQLAP
jgi:GWxTD domain-containing protein